MSEPTLLAVLVSRSDIVSVLLVVPEAVRVSGSVGDASVREWLCDTVRDLDVDADCELLIVMESVRVSLELRVPERLILPLFDRDGLAECVTD